MSVREYIGARYVPLFADPIEWDNTKTYEPLTIVYYQGNSYTSRQAVPTGIAITNETYWALTGNYNAQIEAYREEVLAFDDRITENSEDIDDIETDITAIKADNWVTTSRIANENVTTSKLADEAVTSDKLSSSISDDLAKIDNLDANDLTELVIIGDSYSTTGHDVLEDDLWWKLVAAQLHLTPRNFAVTGTGYTDPTAPNFAAQVQNAINSSAFDNDKVKYVIIYGGRNDLSTAFADGMNYVNYVGSTINAAKTGFANAQIIVAGVNTWVNYSFLDNNRNKTDWLLTRHQQVAARDNGVAFINMLATLAGYPSLFGTGNHPNALGNKAIASNILNGIAGNSVSGYPYKYWPLTVISGTNPSSGLQIANINGIIRMNGLITLDSNGESILELPYGHGIFTYDWTTFAGISNSTKTPIYMDRSGLTNLNQVKLHGPASERITIDAILHLNAV